MAVIIPALNEEHALAKVLQAVPANHVDHVIVADNGSTDNTADVAVRHGAHVVTEPRKGYGAAVQAGLALLNRQWPQTDIVVFLDGDHSDHPELLPELIKPITNGDADFVLGSRLLGIREPGAMPWQSTWGNRLACQLMKLRWGVPYTEAGPVRVQQFPFSV